MAVLTFVDVVKSFGVHDVLRGAGFLINPRSRVGLIGPNGAGKTTLLRLATGEEQPDSGRVVLAPNTLMAALAQEPLVGDARTVLEAAQRPTLELQHTWQELTELEAGGLHDEAVIHRHDELHHRYQDLRGYECETRAREVLGGLGLPEATWNREVRVLSGGERTRLALAQVLVLQPDLLLLDEPTNHIDWDASEWLQEYLQRYPGAALMISHDRYFLDATAEEIVELDGGKCRTYKGNYSAYTRKKALEVVQAEEAYRRQKEEVARQQEIIQRLRSHRKYNSMHSRERTLEKLQDDLAPPPRTDARGIKMRVKEGAASGREVLSISGLSQELGGRVLFSDLDLILERGDRLAIIGPNGAGKSTLLRTIAGVLPQKSGSVEFGYRVQPAYFAQDLSMLDPDVTVWDTLYDTGMLDIPQTIQALHQFLFVGDALQRPVGALSGGERTRLALCTLMVTRPNLLLLDEPTNHLDIASREAVEGALRRYPGAMVVVSHDRYLLQAVATRVLEMQDGRHHHYLGAYRDYRIARDRAEAKQSVQLRAAPPRPGKSKSVSPARQLQRVEAEIARVEARQKELAQLLGDAAAWQAGTAGPDQQQEYDALEPVLIDLYAQWEELAEAASAVLG